MKNEMHSNQSDMASGAYLNGFKVNFGTYVLIFESKSHFRLMVGKLGFAAFPAGWYAYTGSAIGPGGLPARIRHHLGIATRPHWHMDYLRPRGCLREIWYGQAPRYDEHRWAACLRSMPRSIAVVPGFGSSDCRCETHLVYFPERPGIRPFKRRQRSTAATARPPIYCLPVDALNAKIE
jgi:Uri superfamily endonuclease